MSHRIGLLLALAIFSVAGAIVFHALAAGRFQPFKDGLLVDTVFGDIWAPSPPRRLPR